jgi:hypothetical protein
LHAPRDAGQVAKRIAVSLWRHYTSKDEPLLESGLAGPLRLRTAARLAAEV